MKAKIIHRNTKLGKPKKRGCLPLFVVAACIIAGIGIAWGMQHIPSKADANISYIGEIPVVQSYLPEGSMARVGTKRKIMWIVIHETDNFREGADAKAHNEYLLSQADTQELSWHYTVDDHEIYHNIPDDEAAFHASDKMQVGGGNLNGIGIEMCVNADGDYEKTLDNSIALTATLLQEYGLSMDAVKKHQDFSAYGKVCPNKLIEQNRWDEFLQRVQQAYDEIAAQKQAATNT